MNKKISLIIKKSREIINDCCLNNGAIIAANSDNIFYPKEVQDYRYVWSRDASFILVAADILKMKGIHKKFFSWLINRAEDFNESGILYQNYYTNGPKRWLALQPDQNGTLLWAIYEHCKNKPTTPKEAKILIEKLAQGICSIWNGTNFIQITQDIWEEHFTFPKLKQNHTYSLAACCHGLRCAHKLLKKEKWISTANEMEQQIGKSFNNYFIRSNGILKDTTIDSSMLGLFYPFNIIKPQDQKAIKTIKKVEQYCVQNNYIKRYQNDTYDSYRYSGINSRRGGGFWPILNFWMSIYYIKKNDRKKALDYYLAVVNQTENYLPEQIFFNDIQKSPCPLAWSHAMFIICSKHLGFI